MEIELAGIAKRFGPVRALRDVSLKLSGGDLLVLTGPNGSGKSTLLNILATALAPDEGEYTWNGRPMRQAMQEVRQATGFLGENIALYEDLHAEENLLFWARIYGVDLRHGNSERLSQALEMIKALAGRSQRLSPKRVLKFSSAHGPLFLKFLKQPGI